VRQINKEHDSIRREFMMLLVHARSICERLEIQRCIHQHEQARRDKMTEAHRITWSGIGESAANWDKIAFKRNFYLLNYFRCYGAHKLGRSNDWYTDIVDY
jgi:hypothetical protein